MNYTVVYHNAISQKAKDIIKSYGVKSIDEGGKADIVLCRSKKLHDNKEVDSAICVGRAGIGTKNVPCDRLKEKHIPVFFSYFFFFLTNHSPGGNADSVCETTIGKIISSAKNFIKTNKYVKSTDITQKQMEKQKKKFKGLELKGLSILIIGLGMVGSRVAEKCMNLGMRVYGKDIRHDIPGIIKILDRNESGRSLLKHLLRGDGVVNLKKEFSFVEPGHILITNDYESAVKEVDFVTYHCGFSGTPMANKEFFQNCKRGVNVINCDRGNLIDEEEMLKALNSGVARSYNADFAPSSKELRLHENCTYSPHTAATTQAAEDSCGLMVVNEVLGYYFDGNIEFPKNYPWMNLPRDGKMRVTIGDNEKIDLVAVGKILEKYSILQSKLSSKSGVNYAVFDVKFLIEDVEEVRKALQKDGRRIRFLGRNKKFEQIKASQRKKKNVNFYAGPSFQPREVVEQLQYAVEDWNHSGFSILEMSHRNETCVTMFKETEKLLKETLSFPDNYKCLFIQGGASLQFGMIPMNFKGKVGYIESGKWSEKAIHDAQQVLGDKVVIVKSSREGGFKDIPKFEVPKDLTYLYICWNETVNGVEFPILPDTPKNVPLIIDASSNFCSRKIEWEKKNIGILFASAQKNCGIPGVTVVVIRNDLLKLSKNNRLPNYLKYSVHAEYNSIYNTPPVMSVQAINFTLKWLKKKGGIEGIEKLNKKKSSLMYEVIENSGGVFVPRVNKGYRSRMNVVFYLKNKDLEEKFFDECEKRGYRGLQGHRDLGGVRASIYNAMSLEAVQDFSFFMKCFYKGLL